MAIEANYIEVIFKDITDEKIAFLIDFLIEHNYEGFEEANNLLKCYVKEDNYNADILTQTPRDLNVSYKINILKPQNWNELWEKNFEPVQVDDFVLIRADFHSSVHNHVKHDIIITPKMSFGTGHHATTYMMIEQMQHLDFLDRHVLDFGTGTGILAILAEKMGASSIKAIDIDDWSIRNARENFAYNNCINIDLSQHDNAMSNYIYDIILANINKNIILKNFNNLKNQITKGGYLVLSGLLINDEKDILLRAESLGLTHINTLDKLQWISMLFRY